MIRIVSADEPVVGDVEIARSRVVRVHAHADVFESASLHGQSLRSDDELRSGPDGDFGVSNGQAFEVVVVRGLHIEEIERPVAVEDGFAVACAFDRDGLLRVPLAVR